MDCRCTVSLSHRRPCSTEIPIANRDSFGKLAGPNSVHFSVDQTAVGNPLLTVNGGFGRLHIFKVLELASSRYDG